MKDRKKTEQGFTLIEILITLFVLAIGLLGLAGLQLTGMQHNHSAFLRSQATLLAYDMADRMRANPIGIDSGYYDSPTATLDSDCVTAAGCTTAEMAKHDFYEWSSAASPNSIPSTLPGGSGAVCIDSTPDDGTSTAVGCDGTGTTYSIKVWWTDDRSGTKQRFVTTVGF